MKFIETAYLPESDVTHCVAGNGIKPYKNELLKLGISILETEKNTQIDPNIANHADLSLNYLGEGKIFADISQKRLISKLEKLGFDCSLILEKVQGKYPNDCLLNCFVSDDFILLNRLCISKKIIDFSEEYKKRIINVNQGYVKCSVCIVNKDAYITDDTNIFRVLSAEKKDVLLVKKGSVRLNGYNYGFIGGCCGKISEKNIAFSGDIKKHSCYDNIKAFANNYGIDLISLSNNDLTDIGSLIPIAEKE